MQIVIDIPEEEYRCVQITGCIGNKTCISNAIMNGTLIPKGHGRIVDISQIEYLKALHDANFGYITWSEAIKQIKNSAPTLVEADTESEDKE